MRAQHPAVQIALEDLESEPLEEASGDCQTTSLSLARALVVGCLCGLSPELPSVNVWDPAAGSGFAGFVLTSALESAGVKVCYRGQDIDDAAVVLGQRRFGNLADAKVTVGNTLVRDAFEDFAADLVIVDAPWGMAWNDFAPAVEDRRESGAFRFGLPPRSDSLWLFVSLALEKLRPAGEGGGRVAALINPSALSARGSGSVRQSIVDSGLLESVTRLPEGLAPSTAIPLYLLTFSNRTVGLGPKKVQIADLQTQFTTEHRRRSIPVAAFRDLEFGLRTGKPGPRNRSVDVRQFIRRDAMLSRKSHEGQELSWHVTTYNDTAIDGRLLESRYGPNSGVSIAENVSEAVDFDPSGIFDDELGELVKSMNVRGWPCRRMSSLLARPPEATKDRVIETADGRLFIPISREGKVSHEPPGTESEGWVLSVQLDGDLVEPSFLAAWLNSEQGISSRLRAIDARGSDVHKILRSDTRSLMRWADELLIPVPGRAVQLALSSADEQLASFQADLRSHRAGIWIAPENAEEVVNRISHMFDDSLTAWLDHLPFPIATALWTAETATAPGENNVRTFMHGKPSSPSTQRSCFRPVGAIRVVAERLRRRYARYCSNSTWASSELRSGPGLSSSRERPRISAARLRPMTLIKLPASVVRLATSAGLRSSVRFRRNLSASSRNSTASGTSGSVTRAIRPMKSGHCRLPRSSQI